MSEIIIAVVMVCLVVAFFEVYDNSKILLKKIEKKEEKIKDLKRDKERLYAYKKFEEYLKGDTETYKLLSERPHARRHFGFSRLEMNIYLNLVEDYRQYNKKRGKK